MHVYKYTHAHIHMYAYVHLYVYSWVTLHIQISHSQLPSQNSKWDVNPSCMLKSSDQTGTSVA